MPGTAASGLKLCARPAASGVWRASAAAAGSGRKPCAAACGWVGDAAGDEPGAGMKLLCSAAAAVTGMACEECRKMFCK